MRHARGPALDQLEPVLVRLRALGGLTEKSRGAFYRRAKAFCHFHEDPSGLFADVRMGEAFERLRVEEKDEQELFLAAVTAALADSGSIKP